MNFEKVYSEHRPRVYRVCFAMVKNEALAEDLTQDTFMHVHKHLPEFRGESLITTWLHSIAKRTCLMYFRAQKRKGPHVSIEAGEYWDGEENKPIELSYEDVTLTGTVDRMTIQRAIEELPPQCRRVFELFDGEGYDHGEIALVLGVSAGGTKSQLHRARRKLRAALEKAGRA